ncbi:Alpha/Beta hydrolase protein [Lentinula raphanica]|nr:Alpha/Beta hydrolase protein [Lentinula raphanica]
MLYDKTPQYPHFAHLPFAKEPFKAIYVFQRILTTLLLVPFWILTNLPRSRRPRKSWSLRQVIFVNFTRRIYRVTEVAGVTWGTRNPEEEPGPRELKETTFEWAPPLKESLRKGVVVDRFGRVPFKRVGCFVWRKEPPNNNQTPVVGIFFHGGGYSQLSAHEKSRTSHIPRRLMKDGLFTEIYAVEYRLLQHAPLPAVIMDAAAVYSHVVNKYYGPDFTLSPEQPGRKQCKIILLGDSSGGNLALALARWVRDEQLLPSPDGLLLFSPSCDTSHAFPSSDSFYVPRPHEDTDYLTDTPEPRALMQRTFLGFKYRPGGTGWGQWKRGRNRDGGDQMERHFLHGSGSGTNGLALSMASAASASTIKLVQVLKNAATRSTNTRGDSPGPSPDIESTPRGLPPTSASLATDPILEEHGEASGTQANSDSQKDETVEGKQTRERIEIEEETRALMEIIHSEYVSPASPRVLRRWGHIVDLYDGSRLGDPLSKPKMELPNKMRVWLTPNIACDQFDWGNGAQGDDAHLTSPPKNESSEREERLPEVKETDFASASASGSISQDSASPSQLQSQTQASPSSPPQPSQRPPVLRNQDTFTPQNPAHSYPSRYPQFHTLFARFPKTFILIGDAERLTTEVGNLARAMGKDCDCGGNGSVGSDGDDNINGGISRETEEELPRQGLVSLGGGCVQVRWIPDAVHDVFMIPPGWWDEKVKSEVWKDVKVWMKGFHEQP